MLKVYQVTASLQKQLILARYQEFRFKLKGWKLTLERAKR